VVQAMSRFPLRILSNASARPNRTSAGRTYGRRGRALIPRPAASFRTRAGVVAVSDEGVTSARRASLKGAVAWSVQATTSVASATSATVEPFNFGIGPPRLFGAPRGGYSHPLSRNAPTKD